MVMGAANEEARTVNENAQFKIKIIFNVIFIRQFTCLEYLKHIGSLRS